MRSCHHGFCGPHSAWCNREVHVWKATSLNFLSVLGWKKIGQVSFRLQQLKEQMVDLGFQLFAQLRCEIQSTEGPRSSAAFLGGLTGSKCWYSTIPGCMEQSWNSRSTWWHTQHPGREYHACCSGTSTVHQRRRVMLMHFVPKVVHWPPCVRLEPNYSKEISTFSMNDCGRSSLIVHPLTSLQKWLMGYRLALQMPFRLQWLCQYASDIYNQPKLEV